MNNAVKSFFVIFSLGCMAILLSAIAYSQIATANFSWPQGKKIALSLSFDDARNSQVDGGTALLDKYGVKATFYVVPSAVEKRLEGWKKAVASGHEIANHSLNHPCSGNFLWARSKAIEEYSLEKMRDELMQSNQRIKELLGVTPVSFAYPCGQTFVGRGVDTRSYVPVVASLFASGRTWLNEAPNDPAYADFAQLTGIESDGKDFAQILSVLEEARKNNLWVVLAGHEMNKEGAQTTRLEMLEKLMQYANDPKNEIWIAPVGTVAKYVQAKRNK